MLSSKGKTYQKVFSNIDLVLLIALMVSFFMYFRINGFFVMLIIIYAFFKVVLKGMSIQWYKGLFFFPAIFILLILGQIYTADLEKGWTLVGRNLSFLLLPIACLSILDLSEKKLKYLINAFILGAAAAGIFCLGVVSINAIENGTIYTIPNNKHFLYNTFMHHKLTSPLGLHAVYFALFVAFSNLVLFYRMLFRQLVNKKTWILHVSGYIFFCILLFLLKSANNVAGFAICSMLLLIFRLNSGQMKSLQSKIAALLLMFVIGALGFSVVQTKLESFSFKHEMSNEQMTPIGIRMSIWECSMEVINEHPILGTGTGDGQDELAEVYERSGFTLGAKNNFNSHNMYLEYWLSNGLPVLSLFVFGLILLMRRALLNKNYLFISFLILFALFSLTESTLRTQKGIVFFVFFSSVFYWKPSLWMTHTKDK